MERVLKLLYNAYISSGGSLGAPQRQALIDNGLGGMLSIEDGGSHKNGGGPLTVQSLLGFNADDPNSPVVYSEDIGNGDSTDLLSSVGSNFLKSPSLDYSLTRL